MKEIEKMFKKFGTVQDYDEGYALATVGSASDHMFFMVSGEVHVSKKVGDKKIIFASFKKGDFFGEMSLISHKKHMSTMEVGKKSKIISLTQKKVEELLSEDAAFALDIVKGLIERLRKTDKYLIDAFNMAMEIDRAVQMEEDDEI